MRHDDLDILVLTSAVERLVLDAQVGEVDLAIEVRKTVREGPAFDLILVAIRAPVVVVSLAIPLVRPLLIVTLQLVVEHHAFDLSIPGHEAFRNAQIGLVDLRIVFELPPASETCVERLARLLVAGSMVLQQLASTLGQDDRDVAATSDADRVD